MKSKGLGMLWIVSVMAALASSGCTFTVVYTVTFDTAGGSEVVPQKAIAGSRINRPADPVKAGFIFDNWYNAAAGGAVIAWPLPVDGDITVYARWFIIGQGSIKVTFSDLPRDESINFIGTVNTVSWATGTFNISVPSASFPGAAYQWYLDGIPWEGETAASLSKPGSDFTAGRHDVTVQITTADHKVYSKTIRFTVVQ